MTKPYIHRVQYYETDKMGITHHSNYIRWMEEARVDFFDQIGWPYDKLEEQGIVSPVLHIEIDYKHATSFPDEISVDITVDDFTGVRLRLAYEMKNTAGDTVCSAKSEHAMLGKSGRPVRIKRDFPELYKTLSEMTAE